MSSPKPLQKNVLGKMQQVCMEAPHPTLKIDVSSARNHCFHKCHRTLKNMEIIPKAFILDLTLVPEEWTLLVFRWWKVGG